MVVEDARLASLLPLVTNMLAVVGVESIDLARGSANGSGVARSKEALELILTQRRAPRIFVDRQTDTAWARTMESVASPGELFSLIAAGSRRSVASSQTPSLHLAGCT